METKRLQQNRSQGRADSHECNDVLPPDPLGLNMEAEKLSAEPLPNGYSTTGEPHEALNYVLGYLGLKELLTVECVCKSLHSAVTGDPLLWRKISIAHKNIDDIALFKITSRAKGILQQLSLFKCLRVTNDGLERVLRSNPRIEKLSVPECTGLKVDLIVKSLKETGVFGLKYIRIGGRHDVTLEQFENLEKLLKVKDYGQFKARKPRIFRGRRLSLTDNDDDSITDIARCPRCGKIGLIFDCPVQKIHMAKPSIEECRACIICIARCFQCGRCLNDGFVKFSDMRRLCFRCCDRRYIDIILFGRAIEDEDD